MVTVVANQKGGVGKTTTAVNLGALGAARGGRVLLVDCDPQSALTRQLGLDVASLRVSLVDLLAGRVSPVDAIVAEVHGCDVLPAAGGLAGVEMSLVGELGRERFLWWSWDHINPTTLLSALKFVATGRSQVAHRATITADATPRPSNPRRGPRSFQLHELGSGADRYTLQVDAERGVLLEVVALRDGEPFHKITTVEITFDDPIPDERFHFDPPAGEEVRPIGGRPGPQRLSLSEVQQRAPFTVLIPERIPENWHVHCVFVEPSERPPWPAQVSLNYNSEDGHESVNISQCAANEKQSQYDELIRGDGWDKVVRDGITIGVTKPGAAGNQAQAHLERDGTFVFLMSETLGPDQLTSIAAGLKPAPSTSSI